MDSTAEPAAECFQEQIRARALARSGSWMQRTPSASRLGAVTVAILLHAMAAVWLYQLMRITPTLDRERIEVRLLDAVPSEPELPEPPSAPAKTVRTDSGKPRPLPTPRSSNPPPASQASEPERTATIDTMTLFRTDGTVRVPREQESPRPAPHVEGIRRGRELMARGLNCEAHGSDDLAHRESVGEEVTRKYLAWIGLYNPAAAQLRAEEEERRQTRCRMWKGDAQP